MRGFVLVLLASIPLFGGTFGTEADCYGVVVNGGVSASCATAWGTYAFATVSLTGLSVSAEAGAEVAYNWGSASAGFTEGFMLTVTGASGDGYAEPLFSSNASPSQGAATFGEVSASLGGCSLDTVGAALGSCSPTSIPFVFGVPQTLTLAEYAVANASSPFGSSAVASWAGFEFFDANGQPLSDVSYSFVSTGQPTGLPEPGTLILTAIACAALVAFARRLGNSAQAGSLSLSRK